MMFDYSIPLTPYTVLVRTQRSRKAEEAEKATIELNNSYLDGRQIFVREDRGTARKKPHPDYSSNLHLQSPQIESNRVFCGNLAWTVDWRDLKDHMRQAGEVIRADVMLMPDGRSKGCGIVEFRTLEGARNAVTSLQDTDLKGRLIFLRYDR